MKLTTKSFKRLAIILLALPLLAMALFSSAPARTLAAAQDFDTAAAYKAKCVMCHGATAEKTFDATKPDEQLVEAVLKGVKPKMPAYEAKGINAEQAKALVDYMKKLKQ